VPWTYAWSPSLLPKPQDWRNQIDIAGFYFLDLATNYSPPSPLADFLTKAAEDNQPVVYIGFGSVPVEDPKAMSAAVRAAVRKANVRALVSVGWAGLSSSSDKNDGDDDAAELKQADDVLLIEDVPHDWLFTQVAAAVHHGGAGTTAIGLLKGLPTGSSAQSSPCGEARVGYPPSL
jgi:sterol 3beta-glucosyltransferase